MNQPDPEGLLFDGLKNLGIDTSFVPGFFLYWRELVKHNTRYGLVSATDEELISRHIIDSLGPWKTLLEGSPQTVVDLGSGGGLPGIPLSLLLRNLLPNSKMILAERMDKRAVFLEGTRARLGLGQVEIFSSSIEKLTVSKADLLVSRAFMPMGEELVQLCSPLLRDGGRLAVYVGKKEEALSLLSGDLKSQVEWFKYSLPGLSHERWLAVWVKKS